MTPPPFFDVDRWIKHPLVMIFIIFCLPFLALESLMKFFQNLIGMYKLEKELEKIVNNLPEDINHFLIDYHDEGGESAINHIPLSTTPRSGGKLMEEVKILLVEYNITEDQYRELHNKREHFQEIYQLFNYTRLVTGCSRYKIEWDKKLGLTVHIEFSGWKIYSIIKKAVGFFNKKRTL